MIAIDPRPDRLKTLARYIAVLHPEDQVHQFQDPMLAVKFGMGTPIARLYTIVDMKRLDGFAVLKMLREEYPEMRSFFIAADDYWQKDAKRVGVNGFLTEPLTLESLNEAEIEIDRIDAEDEPW